MTCNAVNCIPSCPAGYCEYKRIRPPESGLLKICDYTSNGVCGQVCAHAEGCDLRCNHYNSFHSCNQTCDDGFCRMNCTTKEVCNQNCAGSRCHYMQCKAKSCVQICNGGECGVLECTAEHCNQACFGHDCHMKCAPSVTTCTQACTGTGNCIFDCHAKQCTIVLL